MSIDSAKDEHYNEFYSSLPLEVKEAIFCIVQEMQSAIKQHPEWPTDIVHQAAIIGEEAGELLRATINHTYEKKCWSEIHIEAIQTAGTCVRLLTNITETMNQNLVI